jgi:hypothetical protein
MILFLPQGSCSLRNCWASVDCVKEGVVGYYHVGALLVYPLHHLGLDVDKEGVKDHLPSIMIFVTEWFIKKSPISAPHLNDLVDG